MTDTKTSAKGFDYASKIGSLIAMSEDENLTAEARTAYRNKAEELMRQYRISEEEAIAKDQFAIVPEVYEIFVMETGAYNNVLKSQYAQIFREVARHAGVEFKLQYVWDRDDDDRSKLKATVVGYEGDVNLAKFLWISARLVFMTRIDARVNPELSDQENAYYMRNSGMRRNAVAKALWGSASDDGVAHGRVQKLYLAECTKRGEDPRVAGRGINVETYRKAYADAFVAEFGYRLRSSRDAADAKGGALELKGRKERVQEAFWALFPDMRPAPRMTQEESDAYWAAQQAAEDNCIACKKTKSATGKCKDHRPYEPTERDRRDSWKRHSSPEARAGRAAGSAAARAVNVQRTAGERHARTEASPERTALGS
jgi:hypothetical protein